MASVAEAEARRAHPPRLILRTDGLTAALAAGAILAVVLTPVATIAVLAALTDGDAWPHLASTVLPSSLATTLLLMAGVGAATLIAGCGAAWLVTMHRFPGRVVLDRLLVLPLAMPTYIAAYCYADALDYAGPAQTALRQAFGWTSPADYWFPGVRTTGGAVFVLSSVLYPYVYLTARASFIRQSACVLEIARTLGRTSLGAFWSVALPLARPALAAGVALALMECLNDLGAVQHLGVETLTAGIYATWLQRSSLGGAAQLSAVLLALAAGLFAVEIWSRGGALSHPTSRRNGAVPFEDIPGWRGWAVCLLCALPAVAGFGVPFVILLDAAITHGATMDGGFAAALGNSLAVAAVATAATVLAAGVLLYARRRSRSRVLRSAVGLAGLGYAIPGAVLALGLLIPLAAFDNALDGWMRATFGVSTGLVLSGSFFAVALACVIRFLSAGLGALDSGLQRISPNLDTAARALGETAWSAVWRVHAPLLVPAASVAALLVFIDSIKELPATLLLRPFNFETLATRVYVFASLEQFEQGAASALAIVAAGLIPALVLHGAMASGRAGHAR